ncbi:MAG: YeeE/YedE thiosulfate transporter family protein [Sediminibacterium sp.]
MMEWLQKPWPWYVAGPVIGLMVPVLLLIGNKSLGVSSSLRHICAACLPAKIPFFQYNWKKEIWNLFFVGGILVGGFLTVQFLTSSEPVQVNEKLLVSLQQYGITNHNSLVPVDIVNWPALLTLKGFLLIVMGGFLVGFGTRYAGGCTSGHAIMGLSNLQWPSLVATVCFMIGGFVVANLVLPIILKL